MTNTGAEFEDEDVANAYVHRPDYPSAVHARLLDLAPDRAHLLDLGCGPGKLARALAPHFRQVLAVDPSAAMLRVGQQLDAGANPNIAWTRAFAEDLDLEDASVGLAIAGASLHWMDPARLFPKLARALAPGARLAIVGGDEPADAPWIDAYRAAIQGWVARLGGTWNDPDHRHRLTRHEPWFAEQGRETFTARVRQPVATLIEGEHSRATWARSKMGGLADRFDADLRALLDPWALDGAVEFDVTTKVIWGRAQETPQGLRNAVCA